MLVFVRVLFVGPGCFVCPWAAAQWEYDSWVSTYTSIARGEMDVVSTTVRDVTGHDPLTFEEVARAALASRR